MKNLSFILVFTALAVIIVGCGPPRPQGMPETAPCLITVLKEGVPMPNVEVNLYQAEGNGAMSITAKTDSSGVAHIRSSWGRYVSKGAPVGQSKVTVIKHVGSPYELTEEEQLKLSPAELNEYERKWAEEIDRVRLVPKVLSDIETTPLEVNVEKRNGAKLSVDIAEYMN